MRFDPNSTVNQGRWRLKDPSLFKTMWTKQDRNDKGISYIVGFMENDTYAVQAIRFEKDIWSEKEAKKWWEKNYSRFSKTWKDSDWAKKVKITRRKALGVSKTLVELLGLTYVTSSLVTIDYKFKKNIGIPVGSLRQGKDEVGDIDIIITKKISKLTIKKKLNLQTITGGEKRIDFRFRDVNINLFIFTDPSTWGAALIHSTGPDTYNVRHRFRLKNKGWKLSQNGLFDEKGKLIKTPTERSLQEAMGVKERDPNNR